MSKTFRVKYPAGHSYDETWERDETIFCPHCGAKGCWVEQGPGDYYVGNQHACVTCRWSFYMPSFGEMSGPIDEQRTKHLSE